MVDFYIFRHGETDINKQKRWQGSGTDVDLNETGRAQAACLFDKLKDKKLEIIYSSPLIRAYHTAQIAAKPLGIEVVKFPDLRECHYGVAEGMTFDDVNRLYKEVGEAVFNPGQDKLDVLAWTYYKTGSLIPCILMHVLNNSLSVYLSIKYPEAENMDDLINGSPYLVALVGSILLLICTILTMNNLTSRKQP